MSSETAAISIFVAAFVDAVDAAELLLLLLVSDVDGLEQVHTPPPHGQD